MSTASSTRLLIIDPQNDFCDLPAPPSPALQDAQATTPLPALPVPETAMTRNAARVTPPASATATKDRSAVRSSVLGIVHLS